MTTQIEFGVLLSIEFPHPWWGRLPTTTDYAVLANLGLRYLRVPADPVIGCPTPDPSTWWGGPGPIDHSAWDGTDPKDPRTWNPTSALLRMWMDPTRSAGVQVQLNFGEGVPSWVKPGDVAAFRFLAAQRLAWCSQWWSCDIESWSVGNEPGAVDRLKALDDIAFGGKTDSIATQYFPEFVVPVVDGIRSAFPKGIAASMVFAGPDADSDDIYSRILSLESDYFHFGRPQGSLIDRRSWHPYGDLRELSYATTSGFLAAIEDYWGMDRRPQDISEIGGAGGMDFGVATAQKLLDWTNATVAKYPGRIARIIYGDPRLFTLGNSWMQVQQTPADVTAGVFNPTPTPQPSTMGLAFKAAFDAINGVTAAPVVTPPIVVTPPVVIPPVVVPPVTPPVVTPPAAAAAGWFTGPLPSDAALKALGYPVGTLKFLSITPAVTNGGARPVYYGLFPLGLNPGTPPDGGTVQGVGAIV